MRQLGFGRIEDLLIEDGLPRINRRTRLLQKRKLGPQGLLAPDESASLKHGEHQPHPQHQKFLADCQRMGCGSMRRVEITDGLPIHWEIAAADQVSSGLRM